MANTTRLSSNGYFSPYEVDTYEQRRLDAIKVSAQEQISPYYTEANFDIHKDLVGNVVYHLNATLWKERVEFVTISRPKTWWDHYKATYPQWMPMWASEPEFEEVKTPLDRCYADINPIPGKPYMYIAVRT